MYTREEKKKLIQRFWQAFDLYSGTLPKLKGKKKKWILYDTKINHVDLKFDIGRGTAIVALELNHRSEDLRLQVSELLEKYRSSLEKGFQDELIWDFDYQINHKSVSRIYLKKDCLDFHRQDDWLAIFQFFALNMLLLQENFMEIQEFLIEEIKFLDRLEYLDL